MSDEEFWSSEHDPSLVVTWKFKEGLYGNVGEWECRSFEPRPVIIMLTNVYGSYILDSFDTLKLKWYTMYGIYVLYENKSKNSSMAFLLSFLVAFIYAINMKNILCLRKKYKFSNSITYYKLRWFKIAFI